MTSTIRDAQSCELSQGIKLSFFLTLVIANVQLGCRFVWITYRNVLLQDPLLRSRRILG